MTTKTIVVLGMHRSGTSLVAGLLHHMGVNMGEYFLPPNQYNPKGYYEDIDFVLLNDNILSEAEGSWNNPPHRDNILRLKSTFGNIIKNIMQSKSKNPLWGWKDPRTILTIELYMPYFVHKPYFIICYRNPENIAKSLYKRDGTDMKFNYYLIEEYQKRLEYFIKIYAENNFLSIKYENFLDNTEKEIDKIIKFIKLDLNAKNFVKLIDKNTGGL